MPRTMLIFWKDSPTTDTALPETNMAPENRPYPKKERIVFQPSIFRCKLSVSGRVFGQKNHHTFTRCLEVAFLYQTHHSNPRYQGSPTHPATKQRNETRRRPGDASYQSSPRPSLFQSFPVVCGAFPRVLGEAPFAAQTIRERLLQPFRDQSFGYQPPTGKGFKRPKFHREKFCFVSGT